MQNRRKNSGEKKRPAPSGPVATEINTSPRTINLLALVCALIAFALYANTLGHDYTVDDNTVMAKNTIVTKGIAAIPEIFTTPYRKGFWDRQESMYRPMSLVMFAIEWQLAPGKPFIGHLVNVLLYALTGFLLVHTLHRMMPSYSFGLAFFSAALFVAHPVHTEVVASIKSRDEILAFFFFLGSLFLFFGYIRNENRKIASLIGAAFCFLLALLSKESAVTFFAVFPVAMYFFSDADFKKIIKVSALFLVPLGVYFALRLNALSGISSVPGIQAINNSMVEAPDLMSRLATAIAILGKYIGLLIFPHPLVYDYSYRQIPNVTFGDASAIMSMLLLVGMTVLAFRTFKNKDLLSFCFFYFAITISLVSNILFLIESTMAERFVYAPSLGYCVALPALFFKFTRQDLWKKAGNSLGALLKSAKPVSVLTFLLVVFFSFTTISRNIDWKSNVALLKSDVKNAPNSARIRYALGAELLLNGAMKEKDPLKKDRLLNESIVQLSKGVEILPSYGEAFYNLGIAYSEKRLWQNAVDAFESAKRSKNWDDPAFYVSSGIAYGTTGQFEKAFLDFEHAIRLNDTMKTALSNWGNFLAETGRVDEAMQKLDKALAIDPMFKDALYNKGNAYAKAGDFAAALRTYLEVYKLDPEYISALMNIGNCYAAMKDIPKSIEWFEKVLAIDPYNDNARQNLALSKKLLGEQLK